LTRISRKGNNKQLSGREERVLKKLTRSKTWLALLVVFTFLVWNVVPLGALAADEEIPGQKPLNFVGAYLTEISNNTSTTGPAIDQTTVPVDPLIKVQFDKNIVNDAVWEHNQQCVAIQTDAGAVVPTQVTRVKDSVNFNEKNNIFITPVNDLQKGGAYKVVVSPELKAKNGYSTLGMTTNNQPVIINFKVAGSIQVPVSGVTLNKTSITLNEGQSERLTATVTPANATNKLVAWSSSNASVATVDGNGNVTGVKAGSAVITVKTADGGKMATCQVTVKAVTVPVTGVTLNKTSITLNEGQSERLTATVTPANATNKAVTWSSSNASVATVDGNGNVTGVKAGSVVITVKTADGNKTATCQVTVKAVTVPVSGVTLNKTSITLNEGQSESLTATVTPANATNKAVTWSSSNASVATVDGNGKVIAVKAGSTVITVKTADGNKTATCQVTVVAAAEDPDSAPLTFVGAYLARMNGLSSVTVSELGQGETSVKPMIKLVFNQNVVNDTVWNHNRQCISLQDSSGAKVRVMVFRISDKTNPDESTNIFVTPLNELQRGGVYKLVVSPELKAKDGQALGETASQVTAGFKVTSYSWFQRLSNFIQGDKCADLFCSRVQFITQLFKSKCKGAAGYKMPLRLA
jgi:uncharacterized protein YjdB